MSVMDLYQIYSEYLGWQYDYNYNVSWFFQFSEIPDANQQLAKLKEFVDQGMDFAT